MSQTEPFPLTQMLTEMYVSGKDLSPEAWHRLAEEPDWRQKRLGLVWQNGDQLLTVTDSGPMSPKESVSLTDAPMKLAHPAEMDAEDILEWEFFLKAIKAKPFFPQLQEPVVLAQGRLAGALRPVESCGKTYEMSERYRGFRMPLSALYSLQKQGFHFIIRKKWINHRCLDEIELVNIMTPAGIFYNCRPVGRMDKLPARKDRFLELDLFYPFRNVRLRTVNHVAATLEKTLLEQFVQQDRLDLLLPHVRTLTPARIRSLTELAPESRTAAFLKEYCPEGRKTPC